MGSEWRIQYLLDHNKTDNDTLDRFNLVEGRHNQAVQNRRERRRTLLESRERFYNARDAYDQIPTLQHPIRKFRAWRRMRNARALYRNSREFYAEAVAELRESQRETREMRRNIRLQYRAVTQNENMIQRIREMTTAGVRLPSEILVSVNNQVDMYNSQLFHSDGTIASNSWISAPTRNLTRDVNTIYREYRRELRREHIEHIIDGVRNTAHNIGEFFTGNIRTETEIGER